MIGHTELMGHLVLWMGIITKNFSMQAKAKTLISKKNSNIFEKKNYGLLFCNLISATQCICRDQNPKEYSVLRVVYLNYRKHVTLTLFITFTFSG